MVRLDSTRHRPGYLAVVSSQDLHLAHHSDVVYLHGGVDGSRCQPVPVRVPGAAVHLLPKKKKKSNLLLVPVDGTHDIAGARVPQSKGRVSRAGDQQGSVRVPLHALDVVLVTEQRQLGLASAHRPDVDLAVVAVRRVNADLVPLNEWTRMDVCTCMIPTWNPEVRSLVHALHT